MRAAQLVLTNSQLLIWSLAANGICVAIKNAKGSAASSLLALSAVRKMEQEAVQRRPLLKALFVLLLSWHVLDSSSISSQICLCA